MCALSCGDPAWVAGRYYPRSKVSHPHPTPLARIAIVHLGHNIIFVLTSLLVISVASEYALNTKKQFPRSLCVFVVVVFVVVVFVVLF